MDKWLNEKSSGNKKKIEELFQKLPEEEVQELKKQKIRQLTQDVDKIKNEESESNEFFDYFIEFKEWLDQRTYLKGDLDKIAIWIENLNNKLISEISQYEKSNVENIKTKLIEQYRKIPPDFLDEKTRIAMSKKIHGRKRTNSDKYYIKKLKYNIENYLKNAEYYQILKKIIELGFKSNK